MRIIAGTLGGRNFQSPNGHRTHPMSDKIRGAIFNMLGDIQGLSVLDAFSGSGALALEAISRGASQALAIDTDKHAHQTIQQNAKELGLQRQIKAVRANASGWSDNNPDITFDILFCDPPYDHTQLPLIQKLTRHLNSSGVLVLSWPGGQPLPELPGMHLVSQKDYGDARMGAYARMS